MSSIILMGKSAVAAKAGPTVGGWVDPMSRVLMFLPRMIPFLFGLGFVAPLIAQVIERLRPGVAHEGWPTLVGLAIGGVWGAVANIRGRWL